MYFFLSRGFWVFYLFVCLYFISPPSLPNPDDNIHYHRCRCSAGDFGHRSSSDVILDVGSDYNCG